MGIVIELTELLGKMKAAVENAERMRDATKTRRRRTPRKPVKPRRGGGRVWVPGSGDAGVMVDFDFDLNPEYPGDAGSQGNSGGGGGGGF